MGQQCSRGQSKISLKKELELPMELEKSNCIYSDRHRFQCLVNLEWVNAFSLGTRLCIDSHLQEYNDDPIKLMEVFKKGYRSSQDPSIRRVWVTVIKKEINFTVTCDKETVTNNGAQIYGTLLDEQKYLRHHLDMYLSMYENFTITNSKHTSTRKVSWDDLKYFFKTILNVPTRTINQNVQVISTSDNTVLINDMTTPFLPVLAVLESATHVYIVEKHSQYNLQDALSYSPALLGKSFTNMKFLLYQLMNLFLKLSKHNLRVNTILQLKDFDLLYDTMWLATSLFDCVSVRQKTVDEEGENEWVNIYKGKDTDLRDDSIQLTETLSEYTRAWCDSKISNFDYLIILNKLAGRRFGEPLNHPIFPWVTNFTCCNAGWRDLKRTKFRLNKGDHQLDATFTPGLDGLSHGGYVQHHISDVLSDITYYIYHARVTPKDILCNHVRSRWVPDEYPVSIERIYDWTPDECIPEFFYDPNIFMSTHSDLCDLKLPDWLDDPEEFVGYHYKMLESPVVSENLHHWIDLMFGYKLEGKAAKREKNVHLSLVDGHKALKNYGIVQLFTCHHPKKNKVKQNLVGFIDPDDLDARPRDISTSWEYVDFTGSSKYDFKLTSDHERKTWSILETNPQQNVQVTSLDDDNSTPSGIKYQVSDPGKYAFGDITERTERMLLFELTNNMTHEKGLGKFPFGAFSKESEASTFSHLDDEIKLYVCLFIEISCHRSLCTRTFVPQLDARLAKNWKFMNANKTVSSWIKESIENVLFPTFAQRKEWLLGSNKMSLSSLLVSSNRCFNFPPYFQKLYALLYKFLSLQHRFSGDPEGCSKISREVEVYSGELSRILENIGSEGVDLVLLYLNPLFENASLQVPMFLYVFPVLSVALGPLKCRSAFVKGLQQLMDRMNCTVHEIAVVQQVFLSHILNGFGQDYFLQHFMSLVLDILSSQTPLVRHNDAAVLQRASSITTLPGHDSVLGSDSLISYGVSPPLVNDSASLSSFNLDVIFDDTLQPTFKSIDKNNDSFSDEVNIRFIEKPQQTASSSLTIPIVSSQEIGNLINIEAISQSLPNFFMTPPDQMQDTSRLNGMERTSTPPPDNFNNDNFREEIKSPFTVLIDEKDSYSEESSRDRSTTDLSEVLEVPIDENITKACDAKMNEMTVSDIHLTIVYSVKWFITFLGATLSTQFIAQPLLKKMEKIFIDVENDGVDIVDLFLDRIRPHLECLVEVAVVYGDNIVIYLYLPELAKKIENATTSSSVSILVGSNLVAYVQLLVETCELLQKEVVESFMEEFSNKLFQPLIRLLATVKPFSTGVIVKEFLSRKMIDILGHFCQKLNREYAKDVMAPLLQQFFSCFDGIYALNHEQNDDKPVIQRKYSLLCKSAVSTTHTKTTPVNSFVSGEKMTSEALRIQKKLSIDDVLENDQVDACAKNIERFEDIYQTFSMSLAYHSYVLFSRVLGTMYIENTLYNSDLLWQLCIEHDSGLALSDSTKTQVDAAGDQPVLNQSDSKWFQPIEKSIVRAESSISRVSWQNLEGTWLENWRHSFESRSTSFQFLNCKLQTYAGHSNVIRDIYVADNEHYFLSASRDKTVKLWLMKNHGNSTAHLGCSGTYSRHSRAVFAVQGIEAKRWVASSDGVVNIWDPVTTQTISQFEVGRAHTVTCLRTLPQPSVCVAAATTDGTLRLYDVRQKSFVQEWKLSPQIATGMVRSMCVNEHGNWIAAGFSSGIISIIDLKVGTLKGQMRMQEGEIVQLEPVPECGFMSLSTDGLIKLWCEDGKTTTVAKGSNETMNSMVYRKQQLLWTTTSNKLTMHRSEKISQMDSYRLNQDSFKGVISKMTVLPTNRLFLFGADNGNLVLYA